MGDYFIPAGGSGRGSDRPATRMNTGSDAIAKESSSQLLNPGLYILSVLSLKTATLERFIQEANTVPETDRVLLMNWKLLKYMNISVHLKSWSLKGRGKWGV